MRPHVQMTESRVSFLLLVLVCGFAAERALAPMPATAQRGSGMPVPEDVFRALGSRLVIPLGAPPRGFGRSRSTLGLVSNGWRETTVAIIELGAPLESLPIGGEADCPAMTDARYTHCLEAVQPHMLTEVALRGRPAGVLVYSFDPLKVQDACTHLGRLAAGQETMLEFEGWWAKGLGEPLAAALVITAAGVGPGFGPGLVTTAMGAKSQMDLRQIFRTGRGTRFTHTLPLLRSDGAAEAARAINLEAECQKPTVRMPSSVAAGCGLMGERAASIGGYGVVDPRLASTGPLTTSLRLYGPMPLALAADRLDAAGWQSYMAPQLLERGPANGQLAFPLAHGPLPGLKSELFVTNEHLTATAKIDVLMWDGAQTLRLYRDPVPLCPGGVRRYDVQQLAGPIEAGAGSGRPGAPPEQPFLSLRVESSNPELADLPPISGVMVLKSDIGVDAYAGIHNPLEPLAFTLNNRRMEPNAVVPSVKINVGERRVSTFLAFQGAGDPTNNQVYLDLYDREGRLVLTEFVLEQGVGLTGGGYIDLASLPGRRNGRGGLFPDTFEGSAVLRDPLGDAPLAVVAVDLPARDAPPAPGQDNLALVVAPLVPRWPSPLLATPTAPPMRSTATATTGRPTATPEDGEPTATPPRPRRARVWLPFVSW